MENIAKKVEYLKGYADALEISDDTAEGKVIKKMLDVLDEMAGVIDDLSNDRDEMFEDISGIYALLGDFEDTDEDDDYDYDDDFDLDDDYDDDDIDYFEMQCPNCKEDVLIDYDMIDEDNSIVCPNCHQEIELVCSCDCDDCTDDDDEVDF